MARRLRILPPLLGLVVAATLCGIAAAAPDAVVHQSAGPAFAPDNAEAALRAAIERYARAWHEGNSAQMATLLHPEFVAHTVVHAAHMPDALDSRSGLALLDQTDRGFGRNTPLAARKTSVLALEIGQGLASATVRVGERTERQHWVLWNNQWRLLQTAAEREDQP
jgi:hypothetical protein